MAGWRKVGALESADNAVSRVRSVERHQRTRDADLSAYPLRLVVVGEIDGLVLGRYRWIDGGALDRLDRGRPIVDDGRRMAVGVPRCMA